MPNQLTVTAKAGPAIQSTATVILGVSAVNYDFDRKVAQVVSFGTIKEYDLNGVTTLTIVLSAGNYTLVLS